MYDLDRVGTFNVTGNLCVRDPVPAPAGSLTAPLKNVAQGKWSSAIRTVNVGRWGPYVSMLVAWHGPLFDPDNVITSNPVGSIGISTGTCMITDHKSGSSEFPERGEYAKSMPNGVTCRTGWGDGTYDVYVRHDENGAVDGIVVQFIPEDEGQ